MDIAPRVSAHGSDSWEANMTYQGITFTVTAQREDGRDSSMWGMEVRRHTSRWSVQPRSGAYDPPVEAVIHGAHDAIHTSITERSAAPPVIKFFF